MIKENQQPWKKGVISENETFSKCNYNQEFNRGGCQTGKATSMISAGKKLGVGLIVKGSIEDGDATKWFIEKPAQQEHWQNGEHASLWLVSWELFLTSVFTTLDIALASLQGTQLNASTNIAIKKAKTLIGCKSKRYFYSLKLKDLFHVAHIFCLEKNLCWWNVYLFNQPKNPGAP